MTTWFEGRKHRSKTYGLAHILLPNEADFVEDIVSRRKRLKARSTLPGAFPDPPAAIAPEPGAQPTANTEEAAAAVDAYDAHFATGEEPPTGAATSPEAEGAEGAQRAENAEAPEEAMIGEAVDASSQAKFEKGVQRTPKPRRQPRIKKPWFLRVVDVLLE